MHRGKWILISLGAIALVVPAVWAAYNQTGNFTLSGKLGAGTDAPVMPGHYYQPTVSSTRVRLQNPDGYADVSARNGALSLIVNDTQTATFWGPGTNEELIEFGAYVPGGLKVDVYDDLWVKEKITAGTELSAAVVKIRGVGQDLAEGFKINAQPGQTVQPGMVVCIDPEHVGEMRASSVPNDPTVAGVISGAGNLQVGIQLGDLGGTPEQGFHPVALTGRVWCLADAATAAIRPGNLLTTSSTPGHAMKVPEGAGVQGAIIGKAMSALEQGKQGLVLVLINVH